MHSAPGEYHGFLWFYFINEQLLRFLNCAIRATTTRSRALYFWLFHLLWLFPWSVYFPAVAKLQFQAGGPRGKHALARTLLDRFHSGLLHLFHHAGILFDALLSGARAACSAQRWRREAIGSATARACCAAILLCAAVAVLTLCFLLVELPTPGDISAALSSHPGAYTLSLGHMEDLTLASFAYLRVPLLACRDCVSGRSGRNSSGHRAAGVPGHGSDGRPVFSGRAYGDGGVRSLSVLAAAGGSSAARARGEADRGSSLLHVFLGLLLHESHCAAAEWPFQQPGVRLLRARRAGCFYRRCTMERDVAAAGPLLPGDHRGTALRA